MSDNVLAVHDGGEGVTVTTYCGPVRPDGGPRRRIQLTVSPSGQYIQLPAELFDELASQWCDYRWPTEDHHDESPFARLDRAIAEGKERQAAIDQAARNEQGRRP